MENLMELLKTRRSYRRFLQKAVDGTIVGEILEAARYASSGMNKQPLSYIVISGEEKVSPVFALTKWAAALPPELGQPREDEKPVLFIAVIQNTELNPNCDTDAGLAISNMTLAAWNHGVGSCIIGNCNKPKLAEMFGLGETQKLHTLVGFGYPSHKSILTDMEDEEHYSYYLDGDKNYVVPKRKLSDIVTYF